jgi:hypothetical protein
MPRLAPCSAANAGSDAVSVEYISQSTLQFCANTSGRMDRVKLLGLLSTLLAVACAQKVIGTRNRHKVDAIAVSAASTSRIDEKQ